jgi:hypothetical protein
MVEALCKPCHARETATRQAGYVPATPPARSTRAQVAGRPPLTPTPHATHHPILSILTTPPTTSRVRTSRVVRTADRALSAMQASQSARSEIESSDGDPENAGMGGRGFRAKTETSGAPVALDTRKTVSNAAIRYFVA